jgi:predicted DNA-binding transcriptional regulator YafY
MFHRATLLPFDDLVAAINNRRLVRLRYDGGVRVVEPHAIGYGSSNQPLVRCFQVSGYSRSGQPNGWKLMRVDEISDLDLLKESFAGPRPQYRTGDKVMRQIIAQL